MQSAASALPPRAPATAPPAPPDPPAPRMRWTAPPPPPASASPPSAPAQRLQADFPFAGAGRPLPAAAPRPRPGAARPEGLWGPHLGQQRLAALAPAAAVAGSAGQGERAGRKLGLQHRRNGLHLKVRRVRHTVVLRAAEGGLSRCRSLPSGPSSLPAFRPSGCAALPPPPQRRSPSGCGFGPQASPGAQLVGSVVGALPPNGNPRPLAAQWGCPAAPRCPGAGREPAGGALGRTDWWRRSRMGGPPGVRTSSLARPLPGSAPWLLWTRRCRRCRIPVVGPRRLRGVPQRLGASRPEQPGRSPQWRRRHTLWRQPPAWPALQQARRRSGPRFSVRSQAIGARKGQQGSARAGEA